MTVIFGCCFEIFTYRIRKDSVGSNFFKDVLDDMFLNLLSKTLRLTGHEQLILFRQLGARFDTSSVHCCSLTFIIKFSVEATVTEEQFSKQEVAQEQLSSGREL